MWWTCWIHWLEKTKKKRRKKGRKARKAIRTRRRKESSRNYLKVWKERRKKLRKSKWKIEKSQEFSLNFFISYRKLKFNYIIYDPELHWCKVCNVFPKTAKDYLLHLHTKEHTEKNMKVPASTPWRESFQKSSEVTSHPDAPTKRAPIRGLQFFEPTTAWFCKLCEIFMGDTFCASLHLKSEIHSEKYAVSFELKIVSKF